MVNQVAAEEPEHREQCRAHSWRRPGCAPGYRPPWTRPPDRRKAIERTRPGRATAARRLAAASRPTTRELGHASGRAGRAASACRALSVAVGRSFRAGRRRSKASTSRRDGEQRSGGRGGGAKVVEGSELRERFDRKDGIAQEHRHANLAQCEQEHENPAEQDPGQDHRQRDVAQDGGPAGDQPSGFLEPWIHRVQIDQRQDHHHRHERAHQHPQAAWQAEQPAGQQLQSPRREDAREHAIARQQIEPANREDVGREQQRDREQHRQGAAERQVGLPEQEAERHADQRDTAGGQGGKRQAVSDRRPMLPGIREQLLVNGERQPAVDEDALAQHRRQRQQANDDQHDDDQQQRESPLQVNVPPSPSAGAGSPASWPPPQRSRPSSPSGSPADGHRAGSPRRGGVESARHRNRRASSPSRARAGSRSAFLPASGCGPPLISSNGVRNDEAPSRLACLVGVDALHRLALLLTTIAHHRCLPARTGRRRRPPDRRSLRCWKRCGRRSCAWHRGTPWRGRHPTP